MLSTNPLYDEDEETGIDGFNDMTDAILLYNSQLTRVYL